MTNKTMTTFTEQLQQMDACQEAIDWVDGRSLRKCWQVADRSDWMLWLVDKLGICKAEQHELACDFAERALKYVPKGEDRPRLAIEAKRKWLKGEISDAELAAARNAAWDAAWDAAGDAALAAAWATWAATGAAAGDAARAATGATWDAARDAAWAAARDATGATAWVAVKAERKAQCRLIRKRIPVEMIERALGGRDG